MTIKSRYRGQQESSIATFNYTDIAEGTGTVVFYGSRINLSGANSYRMSSTKSWGDQPYTDRTTDGTTTMNFDSLPFNLPQIVNGTAFFQAGFGTPDDSTNILTAQLQRVRGAVVTNITDVATSQLLTGGATPASLSDMASMTLACTLTHFKKDDILRCVVTMTSSGSVADGDIGHSPNNVDGRWTTPSTLDVTTTMEMHIPFRIDL